VVCGRRSSGASEPSFARAAKTFPATASPSLTPSDFAAPSGIEIPTEGTYVRGLLEVSTRPLGSTANFRHYFAEVKKFIPLDGSRYVTAMSAA
jgi:hypothetical protein